MKIILGIAAAMSSYGCICCMPMIDKSLNYSAVEATVTGRQVNCYIAFRTNYDRTPVSCDANSSQFRKTGYSPSELRQKVTIYFTVETGKGPKKAGKAEIRGRNIVDHYTVGDTITVYVKDSDPSKFRL